MRVNAAKYLATGTLRAPLANPMLLVPLAPELAPDAEPALLFTALAPAVPATAELAPRGEDSAPIL